MLVQNLVQLYIVLPWAFYSAGCGWRLVLINCERKILLAGWWLVLGWCERKILLTSCSEQSGLVHLHSYKNTICLRSRGPSLQAAAAGAAVATKPRNRRATGSRSTAPSRRDSPNRPPRLDTATEGHARTQATRPWLHQARLVAVLEVTLSPTMPNSSTDAHTTCAGLATA